MQQRGAIVTGASSGIGEATARRLVADGWRVAGLARRADRLQALEAELGGAFVGVPCDLSVHAGLDAALDRARSAVGGPAALVYSAGAGVGASMLEGTAEEWSVLAQVNVVAAARCARHLLPGLQEARGHVVFLGSMSGHRVPAGAGMYAASKHALRGMAEALRLELRQAGIPVRVSVVSPGNVDTRFALEPGEPDRSAVLPYEPLRADDIADLVAYVLAAPPHVEIADILVRPAGQAS
ncbi:MAG: SDR family NAD(P)-dependent oxidoreductase [Myxococcota bacterium]